MRRRELIGLFVSAALPIAGRAASKPIRVIGYLHFSSSGEHRGGPLNGAFLNGLNETGFFIGKNVDVEYRWAVGEYERSREMVTDLVRKKVDVIVAFGPPLARAAKEGTSTIPIVFEVGNDAVESGLVTSLSHPGGNATGINVLFTELTPKLLEIIAELIPDAKTFGLLVNPGSPTAKPNVSTATEAAAAKGARLVVLKASTPDEIDAAFLAADEAHVEAVVIGADPFLGNQRKQLIAQAAGHKIPAIYFASGFARDGGLMSYGPNLAAVYRQMGVYVGRILIGDKPSDLPVEQPTKFDLAINLKTAKKLGLTVPPSLLGRADEVIE
jgi:putative ABC transport system substrate-binding protein